MNNERPVEMNALSISAAILVLKALITLGQGMGWWVLDSEKNSVLIGFIDTALPIILIWLGAIWTKRNVTPLAKPKDVDGATLSREGDVPAIKEMAKIQEKAIEINKEVTRGLDS